MKNVWIIHNSRSGNSEKLSNNIADGLKNKFNVKVDSIKTIEPEGITGYNPDALIIGARIIAGNTDRKMTKFVKNLDSYFEGQIPKIATLNSTCIGDVCPEILDVKIEKKKDPIIQDYINMLIDFIGE